MAELNSVQKFFKGKTVFITGASGFMGKVLIEKLLYSCSDIKEIIILVRPKKGKTAIERVNEFKDIPVFQRIVGEKPEQFKKINPVLGDVTFSKLGLNDEHLKYVLKNTEIIFHLAATLKLEGTLKPAIQMNLMGTKFVIDLAKEMPKLIQVVHASTAFCYSDQEVLFEDVYDHPDKPEDLIRCAEWMTEETMAAMQKQILDYHPNTYTYTKRLAEIMVRDEYANIPICIVRPSIVTPSYKEPFPGWVDSLNGPVGIMLAAAKGVLRSMLMDTSAKMEAVPVDSAINCMILVAKEVSTQEKRPEKVPVYNITVSESKKLTFGHLFLRTKEIGYKNPCTWGLWYPNGTITENVFIHTLNVFFFQLIPAYIIDFFLLCTGQKRFMVYVQKRIAVGLEVVQFFTMRHWDFRSDKLGVICEKLSPSEHEMFFIDSDSVGDETDEYIYNCLMGARQYCIKDPLSTLPKARIQLKVQYVLDRFCKILFFFGILCAFYKYTGLRELLSQYLN
ncbi:unnamed protein product [Diamesa tonsa]